MTAALRVIETPPDPPFAEPAAGGAGLAVGLERVVKRFGERPVLDGIDLGAMLASRDGRGHAREAAANDQDAPGCQRHGVSPFVD